MFFSAPATFIVMLTVGVLLVLGAIILGSSNRRTRRRRICAKCGAVNRHDAQFCAKCGNQLSDSQS